MNRDLLLGLLIGLIIGWLVEWVIDYLYWRRKFSDLQKECGDDLILINGIGPQIEQRLNKAGIYTFGQLADLKPEQLCKYIGQAQNLADEEDLIKQARHFVKQQKPKKDKK
jgi:predicted flap endonuclease-1-like 5' DNA nuclease